MTVAILSYYGNTSVQVPRFVAELIPSNRKLVEFSMSRIPKDVGVEFAEGKRFVHFLVRLKNVPGVFEKAFSIPFGSGAKILSDFHTASYSSSEAVWSFFADYTEANGSPEETAGKLRSQPETIEVKYEVSKGGLLIDGFHFPLRYGNDFAVLIRSDTAKAALARMNEILGWPLAGIVLYDIGEAAGKRTYDAIVDIVGKEVVEKNLSYMLLLYGSLGWGVFQVQAFHPETKTATVRVFNNFECSFNKASIPTSNFIRGHLAGWLGQMFGTADQFIVETSCIAKGDKFCEFKVKPV
jgi:predicted hydrocarbon binding protein